MIGALEVCVVVSLLLNFTFDDVMGLIIKGDELA